MRNNPVVKILLFGSLIAAYSATCLAVDSVSAEVASGNKSQLYRVGAQWNMDGKFAVTSGSEIWGFWDLTGAIWRQNKYQNELGATKSFLDLGFTPTGRWQAPNHQGAYLEAGLGPHLNTGVYENNGRRLSTHLQFGTALGVGYTMANGLDLALKITHFSNGSIKQPNNGVNLAIAKVGYKF